MYISLPTHPHPHPAPILTRPIPLTLLLSFMFPLFVGQDISIVDVKCAVAQQYGANELGQSWSYSEECL